MGKIYELTTKDIEDIIEDIIQNNEEIKEWCDRNKQVKSALTSIFYVDDMKNEENIYQNYENQYYGTGKKASLYLKNTNVHICARDIVLEFIKIIFSHKVWRVIWESYCALKGIEVDMFSVGAVIDLIMEIKKIITNNVIKLTEEKLCFYLQIITHYREHKTVKIEEILEWLPEEEKECCWGSSVLECDFRENMCCVLKCKENYYTIVQKKLNEMVELRVLMENVNQKDEYKANY